MREAIWHSFNEIETFVYKRSLLCKNTQVNNFAVDDIFINVF